ncbi:MAG: N-acetyltransferase [Lachnospiraceae bacterium]|nr:N-acetyltransferase [Lachnospiraceae bacterium]
MLIRKAELKDLKDLLEIYNNEVVYGISTLDIRPKTLEEWKQWFDAHNIDNHPLIVAEIDGHAAGYASLSSYREKEAYCSTVELSVYVAASYRKRGIAAALMKAILDMAKEDESIHMVVSVITGGNEASIRLHDKYGFTYCGSIHEVGVKFSEYRDIENYELRV